MQKKYIKNILIFLGVSCTLSTVNAETMRIMPVGDSITYGIKDAEAAISSSTTSGYRNYLWYQLQDANYSADFVGSVIAGHKLVPAFDPNNEGHPGWKQNEVAQEMTGYMQLHNPDIVLLHIGTNDRGTTNPSGINSILDIVDSYEIEKQKSVRVLVALIIDRRTHDGRIKLFNDNLSALLQTRITNGDNISIVNMYSGAGLTSSDYGDNTHLNNKGYQKMANVWFQEIIKPFDVALNAFPYSLVGPSDIESISPDPINNSITFVTKVPNNGIVF